MRVRFLAYLLAVGLIAGLLLLLAGCGGGGKHNNGQSKGSKAEQTKQKGLGKEKTNKQAAPKWDTFKGTVASVQPDKDTLVVKRKNGEAITLKYKPDKVQVELDDEEAGPEAIKEGQRVTEVRYLKFAKVNIARSITLHSEKSGKSGSETTG